VKKSMFVIALISCMAGAAQAQDPGATGGSRGRLGAGVLLGLPVGDFGDFVDLNIGALADFDYVLTPMLSLTGRAGFIFHLEDIEGFSFSTIPIWAGAKYYFAPVEAGTRFFAAGELAFNYNMVDSDIGDDSELNVGLNLGGGVELGALSIRAFLAMYDLGDADETLALTASLAYYFLAF
jgi:hypothetical protein